MSRSNIVGLALTILCTSGTFVLLRIAMQRVRADATFRTRFWLAAYLMLLLAMVATFVLGFAFHDWTKRFTSEDRLVEWTTFWVALGAALSFGIAVWRARARRSALFPLLMLLLSIGIAGEEIAWGQRVLGFEAPTIFHEHNLQQETTLHNLRVGPVQLEGWVQAFLPLLIVLSGLFWTKFFPGPACIHAGLQFSTPLAGFAVIFALYFLLSSFPFQSAEVVADMPLAQVPAEFFYRHSSPQSELSELLCAVLLLVAALALATQEALHGELTAQARASFRVPPPARDADSRRLQERSTG